MNGKWRLCAAGLLCITLSGCATFPYSLTDHPKRTVRYPARTGAVLGGIVGVPVNIVLAPITVPVAAVKGESVEEKAGIAMIPFAVCTDAGTGMLGGPAYLVFGWWGHKGSPP